MHRGIPAFVMLLSIALCCFAPALSAQERQDTEDGQFDTSKERIGELRLGMPEKDIAVKIPCKQPKKSKEELEGATGEYVQDWKYAECGIELKMGSERKRGPKIVQSISVTGPSKLVTSGGIHIGSTEAEVTKAYGPYRDQEMSRKGEQFVAGSVYDGMIFDFKDGKVVRIFLGAAAE
jgi:hypothetical protein